MLLQTESILHSVTVGVRRQNRSCGLTSPCGTDVWPGGADAARPVDQRNRLLIHGRQIGVAALDRVRVVAGANLGDDREVRRVLLPGVDRVAVTSLVREQVIQSAILMATSTTPAAGGHDRPPTRMSPHTM